MLGFVIGVIAFVVGLGFIGTLLLLGVYKLLNYGVDNSDSKKNGD